MTALAARRTSRGVTLGADSAVTTPEDDGSELTAFRAIKITRTPWGACACAGAMASIQLALELAREESTLEAAIDAIRHCRARNYEAILTDGARIVMSRPGAAVTAGRYASAGSGTGVCLGALHAGASVRRAIEIASALVPGVGGAIDVVRVRAPQAKPKRRQPSKG